MQAANAALLAVHHPEASRLLSQSSNAWMAWPLVAAVLPSASVTLIVRGWSLLAAAAGRVLRLRLACKHNTDCANIHDSTVLIGATMAVVWLLMRSV
jgi:hypothetical protein